MGLLLLHNEVKATSIVHLFVMQCFKSGSLTWLQSQPNPRGPQKHFLSVNYTGEVKFFKPVDQDYASQGWVLNSNVCWNNQPNWFSEEPFFEEFCCHVTVNYCHVTTIILISEEWGFFHMHFIIITLVMGRRVKNRSIYSLCSQHCTYSSDLLCCCCHLLLLLLEIPQRGPQQCHFEW